MKKLFIFLITGIFLFSACAKIEDLTIGNSTKANEITFTTKNGVATRAIVENTTMQDEFGVYGYVVPGTYSADGGYLMKNAEYDKKGNAVDGPYYWPKSDNYTGIDFIFTAYSQFVTAPTWENDTLKLAVPALTQALVDNPADFNDILWAQESYNHHQNGNVGAEHERVVLNFKHALSWLQFRGEVDNANVKWAKVKSIKFERWQEGQEEIPANPGQEAIEPYDEITDTWVNLKKTYSAVGSATKLKGPGESTYTNAAALPDELVAEIKSYYTIDNGDAGDYDLHMGNTVWASNVIKQLRRTDKAIPEAYDLAVEMTGGEVMHFFNGWKYLQDNGYDIQPANTGGKPAVWDYVLIDAFENGQAYTVVGLNCWDSNAAPQHTVVHHEGQEYIAPTEYQPAIPEGYVADGVYSDGVLKVPTNSLYTDEPAVAYGTEKNTELNYCPQEVTIATNEDKLLGDALVIPQAVPEYITVVFDICIANPNGDEVVFTDRRISRVINVGKDADKDADYTSSWAASNKYIYHFRFDGDILDFTISITGWAVGDNEYHVWDYQE